MSGNGHGDQIEVELGVVDLVGRALGDARLSPTEVRLLAWLAARPDEVVDRDTLLREVWGHPAGSESRTVFATIERLRRKIERDPRHPRHLVTIGRSGYAWRPLRVASPPPALIPPSGDAFVGRVDEVARIRAGLEGGPVTLRGPGGVGKTRLALEFARLDQPDRPGGVWFCDLSADRTARDVVQTLAAALDLPLASADPARQVERLARVLRVRERALVVFDNAETVPGPLAEVLARWPRPWPAILATSRRALDLPGERVVAVDPLPTGRGAGPSDAARLFLERTRERRRTPFSPSGDALDAIERTVAALDGLPLAIELAVRWTRLLEPTELLERLRRSGLPLQAAPEDDRPDRHRTLEAAILWSWDELDPAHQRALAACSVFRGTFDAAAAEAVVPDDEAPALELLDGLVRASLVRAEDRAGLRRLSLLASIATFAAARLQERPALERQVRDAHAAHFARLGSGAYQRSLAVSSTRSEWDRLRLELGNLQAAIDRAPPDDAARAAIAAAAVLRISGPTDREHEPLERVLDRPDASALTPPLRIELLADLGAALRHRDPDRALATLREGLALARAHGALVPRLLETLGTAAANHGDPTEAEALLTEAVAAYDAVTDRFGAAVARGELASLHLRTGRLEEARRGFELALRVQRELGAAHSEAVNLGNLGVVHLKLARYELALTAFERARALHHALGNPTFDSLLVNNLGYTYSLCGRTADAERAYREAVALGRAQGNPRDEASAQCNLAWLLLERGATFEAAEHLDAAEALFDTLKLPTWVAEVQLARAVLHRLEGDPARSVDHLDQANACIVQFGLGAEALAHERAQRGLAALAQGDRALAARCLAEAEGGLDGVGGAVDAVKYTELLRRGLQT